MNSIHAESESTLGNKMLNKVPQITLYFWIIKILCTTVGETGADLLNENLKLGLTKTSIIMSVLLIIILIFQFRSNKYVPSIYFHKKELKHMLIQKPML